MSALHCKLFLCCALLCTPRSTCSSARLLAGVHGLASATVLSHLSRPVPRPPTPACPSPDPFLALSLPAPQPLPALSPPPNPAACRDVSPTTQMPLPHKMLTPNAVLRSSLLELLRSAGMGSLAC